MRRPFLFAGALLALAVSARAAVPTMPVTDIRPGMHGIVYTVLQGTEVVPIETEILGVAENSVGPGHDLIIGKLVDPKTSLVEAVHGMSGSPLYIDGKLAGALSRRLTVFEKDGHCGFTPIADMLQVDAMPDVRVPAAGPAQNQSQAGSLTPFLKTGGLAALPVSGFALLDVPLSVNGLPAEALHALMKGLGLGVGDGNGQGGLVPITGGARSEARLTNADLKPGSPVAAVLMTGDLSMAGTGTVTWRDGKRLLAFGHPMMNIGHSAWGMAPAEIITTIPSYYMPYKLSNTGPVVGAIVQDRLSAVDGLIGAAPAMAPYRVERVHEGHPLPALSGTFSTESTMAPLLVAAAASGAVTRGNEAGRTLFLRATGELRLQGLPPLRLDGVYSGEDAETAAALLSLVLPVQLLYAQDWARPIATGLDLKMETAEELRSWSVEDARLAARRYDAGDPVSLTVTLREQYGRTEERRFDFRLPPNLKTGPLRLRIADGATLDRAMRARAIPSLQTAAELVDLLNRRRSQDRLYVQLVTDAPGQVVDERELPSLPSSVLSVMGKGNRGEAPVALREQVWYETSAPVPGVVTGQETLQLELRP